MKKGKDESKPAIPRRVVPEACAAQKEARAEVLQWIQTGRERMFGVFKKAYETTSLSAAIKAKCIDCVCFGATDDITNCTAWRCPLWNVRPYQKGASEESSEE